MPDEYSDRGFAQYIGYEGERTSYGDVVRVYESSAARGSYVWLTITGSAHLDGPPKPHAGIPYGVAEGSISAHMTVANAKRVRDALDEFIENAS